MLCCYIYRSEGFNGSLTNPNLTHLDFFTVVKYKYNNIASAIIINCYARIYVYTLIARYRCNLIYDDIDRIFLNKPFDLYGVHTAANSFRLISGYL